MSDEKISIPEGWLDYQFKGGDPIEVPWATAGLPGLGGAANPPIQKPAGAGGGIVRAGLSMASPRPGGGDIGPITPGLGSTTPVGPQGAGEVSASDAWIGTLNNMGGQAGAMFQEAWGPEDEIEWPDLDEDPPGPIIDPLFPTQPPPPPPPPTALPPDVPQLPLAFPWFPPWDEDPNTGLIPRPIRPPLVYHGEVLGLKRVPMPREAFEKYANPVLRRLFLGYNSNARDLKRLLTRRRHLQRTTGFDDDVLRARQNARVGVINVITWMGGLHRIAAKTISRLNRARQTGMRQQEDPDLLDVDGLLKNKEDAMDSLRKTLDAWEAAQKRADRKYGK